MIHKSKNKQKMNAFEHFLDVCFNIFYLIGIMVMGFIGIVVLTENIILGMSSMFNKYFVGIIGVIGIIAFVGKNTFDFIYEEEQHK